MALVIFWLAQISDILTTIFGKTFGYQEVNRLLHNDPNQVLIAKLFLLFFVSASWALINKSSNPRLGRAFNACLFVCSGAVFYVAYLNILLFMKV